VLVESNFTRTSNLIRTLEIEKIISRTPSRISLGNHCAEVEFRGEPEPGPKNLKPENLVVSPKIRLRESPGVARFDTAWGLGCRPLNGPRGGQSEGVGWLVGRGSCARRGRSWGAEGSGDGRFSGIQIFRKRTLEIGLGMTALCPKRTNDTSILPQDNLRGSTSATCHPCCKSLVVGC